jgi:hypothetical protein
VVRLHGKLGACLIEIITGMKLADPLIACGTQRRLTAAQRQFGTATKLHWRD